MRSAAGWRSTFQKGGAWCWRAPATLLTGTPRKASTAGSGSSSRRRRENFVADSHGEIDMSESAGHPSAIRRRAGMAEAGQGEGKLYEARLRGKVAIVTGGARGLGRAVAERLSKEGAAVCIMSLHGESAQAAAGEIARKFGATIAVGGDIAVEDDVRACVERTVSVFGRLDIMVNNAGTIAVDSVADTSVEEWDRVIATNLRGTFLGCREAARQMIRQGEGGRILNCSSG